MPSDIAQAFNYHLKYLGGKPIIQLNICVSPHLDQNIGGVGELRGKALYCRYQTALALNGFFQPAHVASQLTDTITGHFDEAVSRGGRIGDYLEQAAIAAARVDIFNSESPANTDQSDLKSDVGLQQAVVNVARNSLALLVGWVGGKPIDESYAINDCDEVLRDLVQEAHIRRIKLPPPLSGKIKPANRLTLAPQRYCDK